MLLKYDTKLPSLSKICAPKRLQHVPIHNKQGPQKRAFKKTMPISYKTSQYQYTLFLWNCSCTYWLFFGSSYTLQEEPGCRLARRLLYTLEQWQIVKRGCSDYVTLKIKSREFPLAEWESSNQIRSSSMDSEYKTNAWLAHLQSPRPHFESQA